MVPCRNEIGGNNGGTPVWKPSPALCQFHEDGDYEWIRELIDCFLTDTRQRLRLLQASCSDAAALEAIGRQAHAIKGSARDVGAGVLAEICFAIEQKAQARDLDHCRSLVNQLDVSFDRLRDVLIAFRSSLPP